MKLPDPPRNPGFATLSFVLCASVGLIGAWILGANIYLAIIQWLLVTGLVIFVIASHRHARLRNRKEAEKLSRLHLATAEALATAIDA
ncbi:MAG TPA: hypothetical protein VIV66_22405, partial [Pyrinomonadaceae bacterium]